MSNPNDTATTRYIIRRLDDRGHRQYLLARNDVAGWVADQRLASKFRSREQAIEYGVQILPLDQWKDARLCALKPKRKPGMTLKYKVTITGAEEIAKAVKAEIARRKAADNKATPPVEPTSYVRTLPKVTVYALIADASATDAFIQIPADVPRLVPGERVILGGHTLVVVNTNGTVAWCSSQPQEPHGL